MGNYASVCKDSKKKTQKQNKTQNKTNETKQNKKTGQREVEKIKKTFLENIVFRISSIWYRDIVKMGRDRGAREAQRNGNAKIHP